MPIIKKWDINIFKYYLLQQKVLRTIFESVFITKKFTQCKTLRTFKIGQLQSIFTSISHPYLFTKSLRLTLPSSISQQFFTFFFFFRSTIPTIYTKNIFPTWTIEPIQAALRDQRASESCENWHCFKLFLLPQSMDSDNRAHNHGHLVTQAQKIGVQQVLVSDTEASNRSDKLFNPTSLTPSTYCHYFHTQLLLSQELTFPLKPVA